MYLLSKLIDQIMSANDVPLKPRRKRVDVPIHKAGDDFKNANETARKTFSANFHSKRYRQRNEEKSPKNRNDPEVVSQKVSRKYLCKENTRLTKENEEIILKFNELEDLSVRKILKLKEKITSLQNLNEEIVQESDHLKGQIKELLATNGDLKVQLEISRHCKNCDEFNLTIHKLGEENGLLRSSKKELEEDVNMLKTVIYRLNVQMERYQERLRKFNIRVSQSGNSMQNQSVESIPVVDNHDPNIFEVHKDHSHTPISWGKVNTHTLGPLLDAYQDTINEKDEIIENYETELTNFTGKMKEIIAENENLYKSLTEDVTCSSKLKIEMDSLKKELQELKDQNDILIKKCAYKQDKLEEVIKCYEYKVEQLNRDYKVVQEQYCRSMTEIAALKQKNRGLIEAQDDFKNERQNYIPLSVHTSSVNECKKWYEELKFQYEQEKSKLRENIEKQSEIREGLQNKISVLTKEKEDMANTIKHLEKQIKKSEAKHLELEHTLTEVQYAKSACRKQLHKAMSFAKDLVNEQETLLRALNQRQQENKVVKRMGSDIATRMDSLRNQLKDVQKDAWQELSTVEQRIQKQNQLIESMKQEHGEEIERLQKIIKEYETNLLLKEHTASLSVPTYLLFRDKHN